MKVLWDFNGTKEPVATDGITMYPTGTGCGMPVESDLSSFDADKMPIKGLGNGEMLGSSIWALLSSLHVAQPGHTKQPW